MLLYCDNCGKSRDYPINSKKVKGNCQICYAYAGPCNLTDDSHFSFDDIDTNIFKVAGFEVKQLRGFPIDPRLDKIGDGAPYRVIAEDKAIFFNPKSIVLVNTSTGERIELSF